MFLCKAMVFFDAWNINGIGGMGDVVLYLQRKEICSMNFGHDYRDYWGITVLQTREGLP